MGYGHKIQHQFAGIYAEVGNVTHTLRMNKQKLGHIKTLLPEMTADLIKQLPKQINNPLTVLKNSKESSPSNSYVVLTELQGKNGNPVIVAIHANKVDRTLEFNKLASVYGREESKRYIANMAKYADVRFLDMEKAGRISRQLQLLDGDTLNLLSNKASVVKNKGNVNAINSETQYTKEILIKVVGESAVDFSNEPVINVDTQPAIQPIDNQYLGTINHELQDNATTNISSGIDVGNIRHQPFQYENIGDPTLSIIQQEDYSQSQGFNPGAFTTSQSMDMAQPNPINQDNMQNIMQETAHNGVNPSSDGLLGNIDDIRLSLNESANSDFAKAVDDVVSGRVKGRFINMGTTPDVFKMIGLPDSVIFMKDDVIEKALAQQLEKTVLHHSHPHNITAEDLKKLPSQLNNPVAIFKSDKKSSNPNGYVVLTELIEKELGMDKPVIAALHVKQTPKGLEVINIASVHGRRKGQLQSAVEGEVLYWNKTKGYPFSDSVGLQLPRRFSELDNLSISNIKTEAELSQYQAKQNNTRSTVETERFKQVLSKAVGESAVKNINVIQSGTKPEGFEHLITADVEGWFDPKSNQINLVSDGIHATPTMTREQRIAWVAWHELAHHGVNVRLKGEYKSIMHRADGHPLINAIATAIQQDRQGKHDSAATSRYIAVEEALAETFAAYQTGNFNELAKRYGVNLTDKGFKPWLRKFVEKVRALVDKLFGRETAEKFSDSDLVMLITEIGNSINGESAVENKGVLFSTPSESVTDNTGSLSKESDDIRFSQKVELNNDEVITQASRRLERIATDIRNGVTYISNRPIELGATPKIFERLGVPQLPMRITEPSKLFQIVRNQSGRDHDISPDVLAEIPYKLQEPLAVFNSDTEKNALVAVMELKDSQNRPVIAAVHINKKVGFNQINKIASIYGKDNAERKFAEWTEKGHLRYLNNEKSHSLLTSFGLQSPTEKLMNGSLENNVLLQSNVVNSNVRFSRSQSALDLSISGKAKKEQGFWGDVKTRNFESLKKRFNQLAGKVDENFADSLRPVNDWIDQMQFSEHTGKFNGRDHEKRRLKGGGKLLNSLAKNSDLDQEQTALLQAFNAGNGYLIRKFAEVVEQINGLNIERVEIEKLQGAGNE